METLKDLIEENLKDLYSAEKQFVKAMPKLAKAAQNEQLREALERHVEETQEQIKRLEEVCKDLEIKPTGMVCHGAAGIVEELTEHLKEAKPSPVTDAMIAGLAQKAEHYEISGYGTLLEYLKAAGMNEVARRLKETMAEEEAVDKLLSQLAVKELNRAAAGVEEAEEKPKRATSAKSSGKASVR